MRRLFFSLVGARAAAGVLQLVGLAYLGRLLAVGDFGVVTTFVAVSQFVLVIADLGLSTRMSSLRARQEDGQLRSALLLNAVSSGVCTALTAVVVVPLVVVHGLDPALGILAVAMVVDKNVEAALSVPVADGAVRAAAASVIGRRLVHLCAFVTLAQAGVPPLTSFATGMFLASAAGQWHIRRYVDGHVSRTAGRVPLAAALSGSRWYLLSNVTGQVRLLDVAVTAAAAGTSAAGLYAAASRTSAPLALLPGVLTSILVPHAARSSPAAARSLASRMARATALLTVTLVPVGLLVPLVVDALFGADYARAGATATVIVIGLPLVFLASPLGAVLQGQGHDRFVAWNGLAFAPVVIAGLAVGALIGGSLGAAVSLPVTYGLKCAVLLVEVRRRLPAS